MQHARGGNGFNDMFGTQEQISKIGHGRRVQKLYTILAAKGSVLSTAELMTLFLIQRRVMSMGHPAVKPIASIQRE